MNSLLLVYLRILAKQMYEHETTGYRESNCVCGFGCVSIRYGLLLRVRVAHCESTVMAFTGQAQEPNCFDLFSIFCELLFGASCLTYANYNHMA